MIILDFLSLITDDTLKSVIESIFSKRVKTTSLGVTDLNSGIKDPIIGSYITCNQEFKDYLLEVKELFENYIKRVNPARPLNVLVAAPPGSGKTFLIKELTKELNANPNYELNFEKHNIGSFHNSDDIIETFRSIQSMNLDGLTPVVFYDEVDNDVGDKKVYKYFLDPLSDGKFYNNNRTNTLGKSIMVFAGSYDFTLEVPRLPNGKKIKDAISINYKDWSDNQYLALRDRVKGMADKIADFTDRIDIVIFIPPIENDIIGTDIYCEALNLSIAFIKKHFKKVKKIETAALVILMATVLDSPTIRQAESMVFLSKTPSSNKFTFNMLPKKVQNKFRDDVESFLGTYTEIEKKR